MKTEDLARELMTEEMKKEQGTFVTLRIIDRLTLLYAPLFDRALLSRLAESINQELQSLGGKRTAIASGRAA
jgi:hypothetical protein